MKVCSLGIAALVVLVTMALAGFMPLVAGPGYEISLLAGVVCPVIACGAVASETVKMPRSLFNDVCRGAAIGATLALVAFATTILHGLRTHFCDLVGGSQHFLAGAASGTVLAGVISSLVAHHARRKISGRAVLILSLFIPLGSIAVSVGRFYSSPMVFAYDPFFGYFSGTLYDTIVSSRGLLVYRLGTASTLAAIFSLAFYAEEERRRAPRRWGFLAFGMVSLVASLGFTLNGPALNHWHTTASIERALGKRIDGDLCTVVYAKELREGDARLFAQDCEGHVKATQAWLGDQSPIHIKAFLFASTAQKGQLMGASDTYIAKPWRYEVYLQNSGYPNPALGHEIMHVVAGHFGRGPFRIAGDLGGLLPNPGLIEGIAVAASPHEGELSPVEWSKAMKDIGILPRLSDLFDLGFLGKNSAMAYTVSGAFVGYMHEQFGASVVAKWYGGAALLDLTGQPLERLEERFRARLDTILLSDAARAQAKDRFERPAIFGRTCPRQVDACLKSAERKRSDGNYAGALEELDQALKADPNSPMVHFSRARTLYRAGEHSRAVRELERQRSDSKDSATRTRALEEIADIALLEGRLEDAMRWYQELGKLVVDEDQLRTIDVKRFAVGSEGGRAAITEYLIGSAYRGPDKPRAMALLQAWADQERDEGLPLYLMARHYWHDGRAIDALNLLTDFEKRGSAIERVRIEAVRLRLVIACAAADRPLAAASFAQYSRFASVSSARRSAAKRLVERCPTDIRSAL